MVDKTKLQGVDHFWRLLELIAEFNSQEYLKEALAKEERIDTVGVPHNEAEESDAESDDESEDEEQYWFDCPFCGDIWIQKKERDLHLDFCTEL